tara:strand:- start:129003 stop:131018 length:2016 start_codon:yes stop_codon:yes gene_type:complete
MKHLFLFLAIFSLISFGTHAQKFDFGKVSEEEIDEKQHPLDPEASSAVLYKKAKTYFEYDNQWQFVHEVEARIKIYNKEGLDRATVAVPLYRPGAGSNEIFSNLKAFTYNLEGGKVSKDKVKNDAKFEEDVSDRWVFQKFTFPNVKEGSVLEYTYRITSPYINSLPWVSFQESIPVNFVEYTLNIPEYLGYKSYAKGFFPLKREESTKLDQFTFSYVPRQKDGNSAISSHKTQFSTVRYTLYTTVYTGEDIPKLVQEEYVNNIDNYKTAIKHELEWTKMPNNPLRTYSTTWEDVTKTILKRDRFGKELEKERYFKSEITPVLQRYSSKEEQTQAIFEFVKNRIAWNGFYGDHTIDGVEKAYKNRSGNIAEINLILTSMLRSAGIDADPVLLSTKSNGIPLFPTIDGFNYVICQVELGNKTLLLDAANKYSSPNILPTRALNWYGRVVRKDGSSEEVNLLSSIMSKKITNMNVQVHENGSIEGKLRNAYTDQFALDFRQQYAAEEETKYIKSLENKYVSMNISDYKSQNKTDIYKPVVEDFSFVKENAYDKIGDKIYIQPLFFLATSKNPFISETREYPIDFSYPQSETQLVNITLPEGYQVESLPESAILQLPDEVGEFKFMISENQNGIQLSVSSEIRATLLPSLYYEALKKYYAAMVEKQTEKIVLSKT